MASQTQEQQPQGVSEASQDISSEKPQQADGQAAASNDAQQDNEKGQTNDQQGAGAQKESKKEDKSGDEKKEDKGPAGGFDSTPIPKAPPGYTLKITIHRATNLPMGDLNTLSSDPYVLAQLTTDIPLRHKEDPVLRFRTPTIQKNTNPEWNQEWIVANVPANGARLKFRVYDEDPADADDRLGNVHLKLPTIDESWQGIKDQPYKIERRAGSKRAYFVRMIAVCIRTTKHMSGDLYLSVEMLGRTKPDGQNGRVYTLGPCRWFRHYSPMLGRLAHTMEPDDKDQQKQEAAAGKDTSKSEKNVKHYNFQANQFQLQGPVPPELYHRFVEFKPWVKSMFTTKGVRGFILGKALHHQHARVYNFTRTTEYGQFIDGPSTELTRKFLEQVHYDQGGRIFTYVLTLDALWRFTETGKEFGVDMLSKHTMHSDVSIYIAFSGEFFIRRLKHRHRPPPPDPIEDSSQIHSPEHSDNAAHPPDDIGGGPPDEDPPKDPAYYELVIDNDSGTYRPNAAMLPKLKAFLAHSLPGIHIQTLDCQADADKMEKMKNEQRERKKREGQQVVFTQGSRSSSISSSDEEDLDRVEGGMGGETSAGAGKKRGETLTAAAKDQKRKQAAKWNKAQRDYLGKARPESSGAGGGAGEGAQGQQA